MFSTNYYFSNGFVIFFKHNKTDNVNSIDVTIETISPKRKKNEIFIVTSDSDDDISPPILINKRRGTRAMEQESQLSNTVPAIKQELQDEDELVRQIASDLKKKSKKAEDKQVN